MEFYKIGEKMYPTKRVIEIFPNFQIRRSDDLMIRGHSFYAWYDKNSGFWSNDEFELFNKIDNDIWEYYNAIKDVNKGYNIVPLTLSDYESKVMDKYRHYTQVLMPDNFVPLDSKLIFANDKVTRDSYATKTLSYSLEQGECKAWDELVGTLYSDEERKKIEWAIGAVVTGDSTWIQKCLIFVGDAGTGKSTILQVIRMLFEDYVTPFDAKALGNPNSAFALEPFKANPLVAMQDDADLSRIEDNTRLNSLISHEPLVINEKHKSMYSMAMQSFIFMGSNKPVMITDARSGLLRRIIDVEPTGNKIPFKKYVGLMHQIKFELGAIAWKCKNVYENNKEVYDDYFPVKMIRATNHFYNFIEDNFFIFSKEEGVLLGEAYDLYKKYCADSGIQYPLSRYKFKTEFSTYFDNIIVDGHFPDGTHYRNLYTDFKIEKLGMKREKPISENRINTWLSLSIQSSLLDLELKDQPAQYANDDGYPKFKWDNVTTTLEHLDSTILHYILMPLNHIVIDFDLKNENGEKDLILNLEAASKWPPTYAELSKGGKGIHLHYIYDGDISQLDNIYEKDIEIKVFTGHASLRRKLSKCNDIPIATISSGLPLKDKKGEKVIDEGIYRNEKAIRTMIEKNLNKEYHPGTKPSIDFIYDILEKAYKSGTSYDVTDLRPRVMAFATNSSNHSEYCVKKVTQMKFMQDVEKMDQKDRPGYSKEAPLVFYDVEVFPNLFVIVFKYDGAEDCVKMINPDPDEVKKLFNFKLVGFNCRRYDNHILYARSQGYSLEQLYNLSQKIVTGSKNVFFSNAYNLSYTDVYDFASNANKMSLKKWEIKLDIHHLELGLPWDKPVPEELWEKVADYCVNDVVSTEKVFHHLKGDFTARQILAELSGLTVNDTTNSHTTRIILGNNRHPQDQFLYRDLSKPVTYLDPDVEAFLWKRKPAMMKWWKENTDSLLPYFPGYTMERGKSVYKGVEVGEGGYVEAEPGMYGAVALDDVNSMHPNSIIAECLFGPEYTEIFAQIVDGRLTIKHEDWDHINDILNGKLTQFVERVKSGEMTSKDLANALKTAINSVYGLTDASFDHPFHDIRNKDNIVAKRGALFMVDLAEAVKAKGYRVAHIKTDSIKIPDADNDILKFIDEFGERYGYVFEHEATYDRMTLINNAVYIARYADPEDCEKFYGYVPGDNKKHPNEWTATGSRFAEPYIFKKLFTHEELELKDYFQTKSVKNMLFLDMNENLGDDEHNYVFVGKVGCFVPVKEGVGGGLLYSADNTESKMSSVVGTKGFRWLESEVFMNLGYANLEEQIDICYYIKMLDEAVAKIEEFGDFNWFVSPEHYNFEVPWNTIPRDDFMNLPEPPPEEDDDEPLTFNMNNKGV